MSEPKRLLVFDGHNDVLLRLYEKHIAEPEALFLAGEENGHIDLPRALAGGFGGGMFAVFARPPTAGNRRQKATRDAPSAESYETVLPIVLAQTSILFRIERSSGGKLRICRTATDVRRCLADGALAAVLHFEGAESIDRDLHSLEVFYRSGLRSLGLVWSRPNIFGHGVPFDFPGTPDSGPGLTTAGMALVRACNQLKIAIDLSHLNEKGFWDVARLSDAPLIASHSNVHTICPSPRNLTDRQLAAIRDSGGIVGLNFATRFIRPDGKIDTDTGLDILLRHFDYLIEHLGEDGVGFGSDFDGADVPRSIGDVAGLANLRDALRSHGLNDDALQKLCHQNWIDALERTWGQ